MIKNNGVNFFKHSPIRKILSDSKQMIQDIDTSVSDCIKTESEKIKKRHPEWDKEMVFKKAQTACGQKVSVPHNSYLEKYDASLDECVSRKISIIAKEHPEWEPKQVTAVAFAWCKEHQKDSGTTPNLKTLLDAYQVIQSEMKQKISFSDYAGLMGIHVALEDTSICYKMVNLIETDEEYIVPVVLAKAMVQPYPSRNQMMAKRPESLSQTIAVDYETGEIIDQLPTFEFHPEVEKRENENGYVSDLKYQKDQERIVGMLHVIKKKLSDGLYKFFKDGIPIHVSIGFMYTEGPGGIFKAGKDNQWNGEKYDASQENILLTHLALLPPDKSRGRCPLPYCGVGIPINDSAPLELSQTIITYLSDTYNKNKDHEIQNNDTKAKALNTSIGSEVLNTTDINRGNNNEIMELKKTFRKYLLQLAQALTR